MRTIEREFELSNFENEKAECIRRIKNYQEDFDIWGHGVQTADIARSVLEKGLATQWKALHDISYRLENDETLLGRQLQGWDYENRKFIVLIAVPKGFDSSDYGGFQERERSIKRSDESVFSQSSPDGKLIDTEKIIGFVDVNTFDFTENPFWDGLIKK